jgi:hypothetical protein
LRRNLITVFCCVNNPLRFFSSPAAARAGGRGGPTTRAWRRDSGTDRPMHDTTVAKNTLFYAAKKNARRDARVRSQQRDMARDAPARGRCGPCNAPKKSFRDDASQHPICVELRKLRRPPETHPAARGGRIEMPQHVRRRRATCRQWSSSSSSSA